MGKTRKFQQSEERSNNKKVRKSYKRTGKSNKRQFDDSSENYDQLDLHDHGWESQHYADMY